MWKFLKDIKKNHEYHIITTKSKMGVANEYIKGT